MFNRILSIVLMVLGGLGIWVAFARVFPSDPVSGVVWLVISIVLVILGLDKSADEDTKRKTGK